MQHAMGESVVPVNPQRVVVLDIGELDAALALGIQPVGAVTTFDDGLFPAYLQEDTEGIEVVGTIGSPNLERILALKPDLILSNKARDEANYPLLSEIAPTVLAERLGPVWKDNFQLYAEALGKEAEGATVIAAYEARLADLREQLGDAGSMEVSILRFIEGGTTRIYHRGSFIGSILDDIGFARPASQQSEEEVWTEMSKELIPELDADVVFYGIYGAAADSPEADYLNDPLWAQLGAVQAGRVYPVDDEYWFVGLGFNAANRVLDDIASYLVPEDAQ
jgi:iron complex transport system substrate-binding protein